MYAGSGPRNAAQKLYQDLLILGRVLSNLEHSQLLVAQAPSLQSPLQTTILSLSSRDMLSFFPDLRVVFRVVHPLKA